MNDQQPNVTPERILLVLAGVALGLSIAAVLLATIGGIS